MAKLLMVQGCTSNSGKTTVVAGLCALLRKRGIGVYPFKPQNMSLNSVGLNNGTEVARAQYMQALACGVAPNAHMSPILLKPHAHQRSQLIIQGRAAGDVDAKQWREKRYEWMPKVQESFQWVCRQADVVIIEGAGSPAEINLREGDLANMGFATTVNAPVVLVGDIELGGVFAHLFGTFSLLSNEEQRLIQGVIVNRFRGNLSLLTPGLQWLERTIKKPVLGVLPYLPNLQLDAEDSLSEFAVSRSSYLVLKIGIIAYPSMSNTNDYEPLMAHENIKVIWMRSLDDLTGCDLMILPGSKAVLQDLEWLQKRGFSKALWRHVRLGGKLLGVCGGFQMLGQRISDPMGLDGQRGVFDGLGFITMETTFTSEKKLGSVRAGLTHQSQGITGYFMHMGRSHGSDLDAQPWWFVHHNFSVSSEGYCSGDGCIFGTYLHGVWSDVESFNLVFKSLGFPKARAVLSEFTTTENSIQRVADTLEKYVGWERICSLLDI